jgi:predicted nucleotidyltransferase
MFGLTPKDLQEILDVLRNYQEVDEAILFGSRALNTHKKGSDIDIALKGKEIGFITATIAGILNEESHLPYFFDILDYNLIENQDLKEHIDRVGQQIYKKDLSER